MAETKEIKPCTKENYKNLNRWDLAAWAKDNNPDAVKWLKAQAPKVRNKEINLFALKREFCVKFIPEIVPVKKAEKISLADFLESL